LAPPAFFFIMEGLAMIRRNALFAAMMVSSTTSAVYAQLALPAAAPKFLTTRADLQRHDLSISGREVLQARIDFEPGIFAPMHTHPGEEIIYVLEGTLEYQIKGQPPVTLKPGDILYVPAGAAHSARNVGTGKASELATYILEKGKPLVALDE
jgi:quercetin dioxygenase-like cupin family protein